MSPSEITLAKMLALWVEWPGGVVGDTPEAEAADIVAEVGDVLRGWGLVAPDGSDDPTPEGEELLYRARKAGVL